MTEKRLEKAKTAMSEFIAAMGKKDRGSLVSFTAYRSVLVRKLGAGTTDLDKAVKGLKIDKDAPKSIIKWNGQKKAYQL